MTVSELIKKLQMMDQNKTIEVWLRANYSDSLYIIEDLGRNTIKICG